ncbi:MAG TPA: hypothetical protein VGJ15_12865 [Pirellulales bacterium]
MRHKLLFVFLLACVISTATLAPATEPAVRTAESTEQKKQDLTADEKCLHGMEPCCLCITKRDRPSIEEWSALQAEPVRGGGLGGIPDFKSKSITFMNTRYYTANSAEGTLASFGKMSADKRYDRFGQIDGVEFDLDQNSWKEHYVLNAAALLKLTGSRFLEFAGVGVEAAANNNQQIDVTFLGTAVPKDEVVRRLNNNPEALDYLYSIQQKRAAFDATKFKLPTTSPPPAAKIVLANVIMVNGTFGRAMEASADGKLHSKILSDGVELSVKMNNGQQVTLQSPVVRCYRTYSLEFRTDASGAPVMRAFYGADGSVRVVPQVFDLSPDI